MKYINIFLDFISHVFLSTLYQLIAVFGFLFIFGILLYFISRSTRKAFVNSYNNRLDVYLTGWLGTPVHELGHAAFCILFGHSITEMRLYRPNNTDGTLGYVEHSYDPDNFYQRVGNFFIGTGPILFGSFILYALLYYCLPNYQEISSLLSYNTIKGDKIFQFLQSAENLLGFGIKLTGNVFDMKNFGFLSFWLFLYLSFCVSSHMQLSVPDLMGMWSGLKTIILILFFVNLVTILFGLDISVYLFRFSRHMGILIGLFVLAVVISLINFLVTYLILAAFHYRRYHRLLSIL